MSLIDDSYFVGELTLPNLNEEHVVERLDLFIDKYEPKFLTDLLGYSLYKDFKEGLAENPVLSKWTVLRDGAEYTVNGVLYKWNGLRHGDESMIAKYVYYWWHRDNVSQTTGIGEVANKAENSTLVSPARKMTTAWNEMVKEVQECVSFLNANKTDYPNWSWYGDTSGSYWMNYNHGRLKDIFYTIDAMNL